MSDESNRYILYGSHASYHTAKTRSYLRKKGVPFIERLPGHPRFREHVRKQSQNHRIPQLETPDGMVIQDSTAIFDYLESVFPDPSGYPPGPRQQWTARVFEVLLEGTLGRVAWHYRWNFMEGNYRFVGREFGRSFRPAGTDEELDHYGRVIADRMEGKRSGLGLTEAHFPVMEAVYFDALELLESHFTVLPYLFGGLPSIADHVLMGPLFGHLARDPVPATLMKQRAPRVYRFTEHMNTPEIQSPEFAEMPAEYLPADEVPETTVALLRMCVMDAGRDVVESARVYGEWVASNQDRPAGPISDEGIDEPVLGRFASSLRGVPLAGSSEPHLLWVLQRGLDWFASLGEPDQAVCRELMKRCGGEQLLEIRLARRLTRVANQMAVM